MTWVSLATAAASVSGAFGLMGLAVYTILRRHDWFSARQYLSDDLVESLRNHGVAVDEVPKLSRQKLEALLQPHGKYSREVIQLLAAPERPRTKLALLVSLGWFGFGIICAVVAAAMVPW